MEIEIKWTKRAEINFNNTVNYIHSEWGPGSARKFIRKVNILLTTLKNQPKIGRIEIEEKGIRSFVFSRQNSIVYRIKGNMVIILAIFDNRQNPKSKIK
jgi:plasmid stabilization system protein ParE